MDTIIAALIALIGVLLGWFIKINYDRYQENRQISMFAMALKNEIKRIREDILERKPMEHPGKSWIHGLLAFAKDIPKDLTSFYEARKGDLDILNDSNLIYKIKKFYEKYGKWKEVRQEVIENFKKDGSVKSSPRKPLKEKEELEEWIINEAKELEKELDKKIKK